MKNTRKSNMMRILCLPCIVAMLLLLMPMRAYTESREDIASGQSNDIFWRIDADGHLTVSGTGDWERKDDNWPHGIPWADYGIHIKTATINIKGLTDASYMFLGCSSLTELDVRGFDTSNVTSMYSMFYGCSSLTELDVSGFDTLNVTSMGSMFYGCSSLTELNLSGFDTSSVVGMGDMFEGCRSLTELDVSSFDTSNVASMYYMFYDCSSLTELDVSGFDTSNVTSMFNMFEGCRSLTELDVSSFDTSNVTSMYSMFYGCRSLTELDVSSFDTSNVTSMGLMFYGCSSLTELDVSSFDTSNVTEMAYMFYGCRSLTELDVSGFDTANAAGLEGMFYGCSSVTELDVSGFDTSTMTSMGYMFKGCSSLTELDVSGFNTSNVTRMFSMFEGCRSLTELDLSGFDTSNVTNMCSMLYGCSGLTLLHTPKNVPAGLEAYLPNTFYTADGTAVTELPESLPDSIILASDPAFFTDGLAGGTSNNISWSIDINGQLNVTGTGDWERSGNDIVPWGRYKSSIKSAVVNLTGTTDASGMFAGCSVLTSVDLSNFDMSAVTIADNMFALCGKLAAIQTPAKLAANLRISLPASYKESGKTAMYMSLSTENRGIRLVKVVSVNKITGKDKEMDHKVVVFQDQFLDIVWDDRLFGNNALTYNNNLAVAGLALSASAEDKAGGELAIRSTLTNNMGFTNYDSQNYNTNWNLDRPAFSIAGKKVTVGGKVKTLICVVVRGTTSAADAVTDVIDGNGGFSGSALYVASYLKQYIQRFYADVNSSDFLFLVTGHSLGGAVASKVGIALSPAYPAENVYVYSFAPPKYSVLDRNKRKNIFEFTNDYDAVPYIGGLGTSHIGVRRAFDGTNANLYLRYYRLLKSDDASLPSAVLDLIPFRMPHHDVSVYMSYLLSRAKSTNYVSHEFFGHYIAVRCPVDVELYDHAENLLCRVTNNVCDESVRNENVSCLIKGDEKYFFVMNDSEINIRMTGTAEGAMEYSVTKLTGAMEAVAETDVKTFRTVALEEGKEFYSEIRNGESVSDVPLFVVDSLTGEKTKEVSVTGEEAVISSIGSEDTGRPNAPADSEGNSEGNGGGNVSIPPKGNDSAGIVKINKISIMIPSNKLAAGKKVKPAVIISPANAADREVSWESSNKKYAVVDREGRLLLKKAGIGKTVTITVKAKDGSGKKASVKIKIMKHAVKKIQINIPAKSGKVLKAGKFINLYAKVTTTGKKANKMLSWSSSNSTYASVDKKGKVTAKRAGKGKSVIITVAATDGTGKEAKIKFKIK